MLTRRSFVGAFTTLSTAAALGIALPTRKTAKTRLQAVIPFCGLKPISLDAELFSQGDVFSIQVNSVTMELPIQAIRDSLALRRRVLGVDVKILEPGDGRMEIEKMKADVSAIGPLYVLIKHPEQAVPLWIPIEDVQRVL